MTVTLCDTDAIDDCFLDDGHWETCAADCVLPHRLVEDIAARQTRTWNKRAKWVEYDDVHQEAWLAYFENRRVIDDLIAIEDVAKARYLIRDQVYRFCRKQKAYRCGYETDDEHLYSLKALKRLLPGAFGGDVASEGGMSVEPRRGSRGGQSGSELDTSLIDVRWGLGRLSAWDRQTLFEFYGSDDAPMSSTGARGALKRLQDVLGGPPIS